MHACADPLLGRFSPRPASTVPVAGICLGVAALLCNATLSAHAAEPASKVLPLERSAPADATSKPKPLEGLARPSIGKPVETAAPRPAESVSKSGAAGSLQSGSSSIPSEAAAPSGQAVAAGAAQVSPPPSVTRGGRTINDVTVAPQHGVGGGAAGATAGGKASQKSKEAASSESATGDSLESKLRSLFDDRLSKDGEVILRVSPETPLTKGAVAESPGGRQSGGVVRNAASRPGVAGGVGTEAVIAGSRRNDASSAVASLGGANTLSVNPDPSGRRWDWVGVRGASQWARLDPAYLACAHGRLQSPPAIAESSVLHSTMRMPTFEWGEAGFSWRVDGPLWSVQIVAEAMTRWRDEDWRLEMLQFRFPAEPFIGSHPPPAALHLMHRKDGRMLVIAVPLIGSDVAPRHQGITTLVQRFPVDQADRLDWSGLRISLPSLLPSSVDAGIAFAGSLSHPPCSEGVFWIVLPTPLTLPAAQLQELESLIGRGHRPLQSANGRLFLRLQY